MKRLTTVFITLAILSLACGATQSAIQTAIVQTQQAQSTNTPFPTVTPTPSPKIGDVVPCGDILTLKILTPPDFRKSIPISGMGLLNQGNPPPGAVFMSVPIEIKNISSETIDPISLPSAYGASHVEGILDGKTITADSISGTIESAFEIQYGWNAWPLALVSGLSTKVAAVFDVNPAAAGWIFVYDYQPPPDYSTICGVRIPLSNMSSVMPTPSSYPIAGTNTPDGQISCKGIEQVNLRKTPGYVNKDDSDIVTKMPCGVLIAIVNGPQKVDELNWWQIEWNGYTGWIADKTNSGTPIIIFSP